jgi:glycopeptide antibiotics resistance protein
MDERLIMRWGRILLLLYVACLLYWMFIGFGRIGIHDEGYRFNTTPFRTINSYIHLWRYNPSLSIINLAGNIGIFIPIGILAHLVLVKSYGRFILSFVAGITLLEFLQMVSRKGSFDVDDIILNTIGASIGWVFYMAGKAYAGR